MKKRYYILLLLAICGLGGGITYFSHRYVVANAEIGANSEDDTREVIDFDSLEGNNETAKGDSQDAKEEDNMALDAADKEKQMVRIENPSQEYYFAVDKEAEGEHTVKLRELSRERNEITDDEVWFEDNQLTLNTTQVPIAARDIVGDIPSAIPTEITYEEQNLVLVEAIQEENHLFCIYGGDYSEGYILQIYDPATAQLQYSMDFTEYRYANDYNPSDEMFVQQRIWWCSIVDDVLYLSIGHNTYASSSPHTGYLLAIELADEMLLWKTEPITCNSYNFAIVGDEIICGYGFTDEDDYLYQVDRKTGVRFERIPIQSQANYIIQKDNMLYVRTYNTNYVFEIEQIK